MRYPAYINRYTLLAVAALSAFLFLKTSILLPTYSESQFHVKNIYPHDTTAFTQGLVYEDGFMYESTGLYGKSTLRKSDHESGEILKIRRIPDIYFGEGITIIGDSIYQLTWKSRKGFIYDKHNLHKTGTFQYDTEGWGLTTDGSNLIMSDGSSTIFYLDRNNFKVIRKLDITYKGVPLTKINELEYINGKIYANIWQTNNIAVIDPRTSEVETMIDLEDLIGEYLYSDNSRVPNGIAYNRNTGSVYITGKLWSKLFEIQKP